LIKNIYNRNRLENHHLELQYGFPQKSRHPVGAPAGCIGAAGM